MTLFIQSLDIMLSTNPRISLSEDFIITGNPSLLNGDLTLILNSRQTKTPVGSDGWVRNTIGAVRSAIDDGFPIIASIGMNTWELILWAVGEFGGRAVIIYPQSSSESPEQIVHSISTDFNLDPDQHTWIFIPVPEKSKSKKSWWDMRDKLAFDLAGRVTPVAVRNGGRLENFLDTDDSRFEIDERYRIEYSGRSDSSIKINIPSECRSFDNWSCLTHWTRRCYGPWPGERSSDYFRAIVNSNGAYPRSAADTLMRILDEKKLRGSGDHIRGGNSVVAFTACEPCEAVPLMRWRKRYIRPTFEPYGIAIYFRTALKLGIKPVIYVKSDNNEKSATPELTQGYGTGDWPLEKEWRAAGDVDLSMIPVENLVILVPAEIEAEKFRSVTQIKVIALEMQIEE